MKIITLLIPLIMGLATHGVFAIEILVGGTVRTVTLKSGHKIWTKTSQHGTKPIILLHGGPGGTHEFFGCFEQFLAPLGFQVIVYDQLDSYYSDKPNDPSLWTIERFTEEIEEVRQGLGLGQIHLLGYSWGAMLAIEYALKYQQHLKSAIFAGFPASTKSHEKHMLHLRTTLPAPTRALFAQLEAAGQAGNAEWQKAMKTDFYPRYFCKINPVPADGLAALKHLNWALCLHFFCSNDFAIQGQAAAWDRWDDLPNIAVPSLVIAGEDDLGSTADFSRMAMRLKNATVSIIPAASHMPFHENQAEYFRALGDFLLKN